MWRTPGRHRRVTLGLLAVAVLLGAAACSDDGDAEASDGSEAVVHEPPAGGTLEVLTYNVAGLPQEISGEQPEEHIPLISPLLADHDVVLTQEDFDWWAEGSLADGLDFNEYHARLRAEAGFAHVSPTHPGPEAAGVDPAVRPDPLIGDGIGIMADRPLSDHQAQAWTDCYGGFDTSDGGAADCLAMKGFRVATMDLDGAEVDVYSLHGEAGGSEADQALQADDFAQLAAFIEQHSAGRAVIVGGDTNLHTDPSHPDAEGQADTEIWDAFVAAVGLTDSCAALSCDEPGSIDKIAYRSSDAVELEATAYDQPTERFTDEAGEDLSDHPPVVVALRWQLLG